MKILSLYLSTALLKLTLLILLCLTLLLSLFTFIDELDSINRHYTVWQALYYSLLIMPRLSFELFPVTAVIGGMTTLGLFAKYNELTAIQVAGITQIQLAVALSQGATILIALYLLLGELLLPQTEKTMQHIRSATLSKQTALQTEHGFWTKNDYSFINVKKLLSHNHMEDIHIYEFDEHHKLRNRIFAERARYENDEWLLEDIRLTKITWQGISISQLKTSSWDIPLRPDLIELVIIRPKFLPLADLYNYIDYLKTNGHNSIVYEQAFWSKITMPPIILMMVLIAIPIVKSHSTNIFIGQRIFIGCLTGILFHIINQTVSHLGVIYKIPAMANMSQTFLLALIITVLLLRSRV